MDVKRREFPGSGVRPARPGYRKARDGGISGFQLPAPLRREELGNSNFKVYKFEEGQIPEKNKGRGNSGVRL